MQIRVEFTVYSVKLKGVLLLQLFPDVISVISLVVMVLLVVESVRIVEVVFACFVQRLSLFIISSLFSLLCVYYNDEYTVMIILDHGEKQ